MLLEWVRERHPSDPISVVALCKAYSSIGVAAEVKKLMRTLDIKYIQKDTLGWLCEVDISHLIPPSFACRDGGTCEW